MSAIDFPIPSFRSCDITMRAWDGTGYPDHLKGSDIPIRARILAVVDCFDALTSDRPYRPRLSDADAVDILVQRRGTMYDPLIVDAFLSVYKDIAPEAVAQVTTQDNPLPLWPTTGGKMELDTSGARLEDIAASTEESLALFDLARSLAGDLSFQRVATVVANHTRRIVPTSTCVFYAYNEESDELICAHATGENAPLFFGLRIARGQRLSGWVAANERTIVNSDPVLDFGEVSKINSSTTA